MRDNKNMYKVEKAKIKLDNGKYKDIFLITKDRIPEYDINEFLEEMSFNKESTGRTYAYYLVHYLNFLGLIDKKYYEATNATVKRYIKWCIYGSEDTLTIEGNISYSTMKIKIAVIKAFYRYLINVGFDVQINYEKSKVYKNDRSLLYGQIIEVDYIKLFEKYIRKMNPNKEYIKWYTTEQIEAILNNFNSLRDKAIFLIQLEGMRIDEVLSIRVSDYDQFERVLQPTRAKRQPDTLEDSENNQRYIALDERTTKIIDDYIFTERIKAENESGVYSDWLFINLNKGMNQGSVLTQGNYRKILKSASKRAGLDESKIRTHSGRSTKANELFEHSVLHPEDGVNEIIIKEIMGWSDIRSLDAYKKTTNKTVALETAKKIQKAKDKRREDESKKNKE